MKISADQIITDREKLTPECAAMMLDRFIRSKMEQSQAKTFDVNMRIQLATTPLLLLEMISEDVFSAKDRDSLVTEYKKVLSYLELDDALLNEKCIAYRPFFEELLETCPQLLNGTAVGILPVEERIKAVRIGEALRKQRPEPPQGDKIYDDPNINEITMFPVIAKRLLAFTSIFDVSESGNTIDIEEKMTELNATDQPNNDPLEKQSNKTTPTASPTSSGCLIALIFLPFFAIKAGLDRIIG